ncbi:MAG: PAS domain S-box protein [Chitinophagaceae bacterium]|nr:PAS domain S-box protein [Chitinophagaceae bacterium]
MTTVTNNNEIYTIARCLKELIVNKNLNEALNHIVEWLAESLNIDRCYISEVSPNTNTSNRLTSIYSTQSRGGKGLKNLQDLIFNTSNFPEVSNLLQGNQTFKVSINDPISDSLYDFLEISALQSLLLIPVFSEDTYWGFIGFGDTMSPRTWRKSEQDLQSLATAIGVAIGNNRYKNEIKEIKEDFNATLTRLKEFTWEIDIVNNTIKTVGDSYLFKQAVTTKGIPAFVTWLLKNIHADDLERARSSFTNFLIQNNNAVEEEVIRIFNKDTGQYVWIHSRHRIIKKADGQLVTIAGTVREINDIKNGTFELEKQKEQYQFLVQNLGHIIFNLDASGKITFINNTWHDILGYTIKETIGLNLIEFIPKEEIRDFWELFGSLLSGEISTFDKHMKMVHKSGEVIWVRIIAKSLLDEFKHVDGVFGSIENTNNKYTADLLLKESNDKLTTILNNSQEIILTIDLENNLIENVNDAISILGYQPEEWVGQKYHEWSDDQRKKFHELMKLAVKSQLQVANQQIAFTNKSNTQVITFEFSTSIFYFKKKKYLLCVLRDISERVQYEQNYSRISQQLSHLINNIDDVYAIYDLPTKQFEFVSNNVETLYGVTKESFSNHGLIWNDIIHLEDLPGVTKTIENIINTKSKGEFFYRITESNGDTKMILEKITVGKSVKDEADKLYIVKTDYTHIENIERSFIESERKFRFISENIGDFISIHDPDWNFNYASPSVKNILGYEPEEMMGMSGFDLVHPDDMLKTLDELLQPLVLNHKETQLRYRLKARDGNYKWVETYSKPVVDTRGETTSIISSSRDVTDQVDAENRLKTSEEQYRLLSENSNDVIATYNLDGAFTYVSPSCLQVLGYEASELLGKSPGLILAKDDSNRSVLDNSIFKIKEDKEPVTFIYKALTKNGNEKSLEVVLQPIIKNNILIAIQAASRDVTERESLLLELEQALAKERELNELRSMFVATASHQFRTPLTVIQSGVEIMELYLEDLPDNKQVRFQKQFTKIQGEVERLEFLMSDILLLGRANAARTPFNPETEDLVTFAQAIVDDKYNNRYGDDRKVLITISGPQVQVDFDKKLIGHAIENIISNAYKYSDKGNLMLAITFAKTQVKIQVTDKGIGIPAEDVKNLFQPFYRATNTSEIDGTGLGLAIVKEFVEKHNGKIFISSKLNKGTTVSVILPLKQKLW